MTTERDCAIIGGGAAGLSAALVLGRARRSTLLIDAGEQANRPAHAVGGLLGQEGVSPARLYAAGRDQLAGYPAVTLRDGEVADAAIVPGGFELRLAGGERLAVRRLLLAVGATYTPPDVPGLAPLWGGSVFHCPFCHGWEVRDRRLAVLGSGAGALHQALLLRWWSDDVVLVARGPAGLDEDQRATLARAGVPVEDRPVERLRADGDELRAVVFADGTELERDGLLVYAPVAAHTELAQRLGADVSPTGTIAVDNWGRTTVPGLFAAGDASEMMQQVAAAMGSGARAAGGLCQSLLAEDHGLGFPPGSTE